MIKSIRRLTIWIVALAILASPMGAVAAEVKDPFEDQRQSGGEMLADFVLVRPVGIAATVLGSAAFIVSWPFSAAGGNSDKAFDEMVRKPARFTFKRPLGDF